MKKKVLIIFAILAMVTMVFAGCKDTNEEEKPSNVYDDLNAMSEMDYSNVNMNVETQYKGITLTSNYTISNGTNSTMVSYSTQKLATIEEDQDGNYVVPDEMIITKTGNATIKNGKVIEQSDASEEIPVKSLEQFKLKFKEVYFSNQKTMFEKDSYFFKAKVERPKVFTGNNEFDGKNMTVEVQYNEKLEVVKINYTSANGALVNVMYSFR